MESHGGKIKAFAQPDGALVTLTFKSGTPPEMEFQE
jgi:hypothetical protein